VQSFSEHPSCFVEPDLDISDSFTMAFKLGFGLHIAIFINVTYFDFYCQLSKQLPSLINSKNHGENV